MELFTSLDESEETALFTSFDAHEIYRKQPSQPQQTQKQPSTRLRGLFSKAKAFIVKLWSSLWTSVMNLLQKQRTSSNSEAKEFELDETFRASFPELAQLLSSAVGGMKWSSGGEKTDSGILIVEEYDDEQERGKGMDLLETVPEEVESCDGEDGEIALHGILRRDTPRPRKNIRFAPQQEIIHETYSPTVYERQQLLPRITPFMAHQIRRELNYFKENEMIVHPLSKSNTHLYVFNNES